MRTTLKLHSFLFACGSLLVVSNVHAAPVTWDTAPGTIGAGDSAVTGGLGTWDTTNGNWTTDAGVNNIVWVNGSNTAVFGGTAGAVTLGADVTVGGLTFTSNGYSIAPGAGPYDITLANSGSVLLATSGSIYTSTGTTTISADIDNAGFLLSVVGPGNTNLSGNISGSGGITTVYGGTLTLSGDNTYTGKTSISANTTTGSTIRVSSLNSVNGGTPLMASSSMGAPTTVANGTINIGNSGKRASSTLIYTGTGETTDRVLNLQFNSSSSQTVNASGSGLLKFTSAMTSNAGGANTGFFILDGTGGGEITQALPTLPTGGLRKNGTGIWTLSGNSSYTTATSILVGTLNVTGTLTSSVTVANGATLSGTGTTTGTLALSNGSTIVGTTAGSSFKAETVTATSSVKIAGSDGSGAIGSHTIGVVRYNTGTGPTATNFSTAGYHAGAAVANVGGAGGETQLTYTNEARTWNSASGNWDAMVANTWKEGDLKFGQGDAVTFDDSGTGGGGARTVTMNSSVTPGSVTFNNSTSTYTVSGTGALSGLTGLTKTGNGTVTLATTNTYTGATTVNGGTLLINGSISTSILTTVASGATIGGSGTVGALTVESGGFINPGNSPGILNTGNYTQVGLYTAEINGLVAGNLATNHDQINVTGTVNITGGSLDTIFNTFTPMNGDLIFILLNDGIDGITGTYAGLAQGALVDTYGGFDFFISYNADFVSNTWTGATDGNDIALRAVTVIPEPSSALLGVIGLLALLRRRR